MGNQGFVSLLGLCLSMAMMLAGGGLFVIVRQNIMDTRHYVQETQLRLLAESGLDYARAHINSEDVTFGTLTDSAASAKVLFELHDEDLNCRVYVRQESNDFYIMSLAESPDWNRTYFIDYKRVVGLYKKKVDADELEWHGYWQ